jgi:hypothetical protein
MEMPASQIIRTMKGQQDEEGGSGSGFGTIVTILAGVSVSANTKRTIAKVACANALCCRRSLLS